MSRKLAREVAMKASYARLLGGEVSYADILEQSGADALPEEEDAAFSNAIAAGVSEHVDELDGWIAKSAIGWSVDRMPKVDLCILRMALYEMLYRDDISHGVSINEAVELAKRFGGDKSSAFINGILGTVSKSLCLGDEGIEA